MKPTTKQLAEQGKKDASIISVNHSNNLRDIFRFYNLDFDKCIYLAQAPLIARIEELESKLNNKVWLKSKLKSLYKPTELIKEVV